jgi:Arc/MetJ-type ribon-helix-helix transcriptional regulator
MSMSVTQVRLPEQLSKALDEYIEEGLYASRSDLIRDALRTFILHKLIEEQIGTIPNKENSVRQVRRIRRMLSKQEDNLKDINKDIPAFRQ